MCQEFLEADIYTLSYNKSETLPGYKKYKINTTFLNPYVKTMDSFRWSFPVATYAMEGIDLSEYDVVLSSSATVAKYVNVTNGIHFCYCYIPTRALWQTEDYFNNNWKSYLVYPFLKYLKYRDLKAAKKVDYFIAQSDDTKKHIKNTYKRCSKIINGPIDIDRFQSFDKENKGNHYLLVSRLEKWKKVEYAIDAFNELGLPLRVVGSGEESKKLKLKSKTNITFLGSISDDQLVREYSEAKAVIFTPYLEYGLIPLEANSCGTPVIAYGKGGIEETMIPWKDNKSESTAIFFYEQNSISLQKAVIDFQKIVFNTTFIKNHAQKWSIPSFQKKLREYLLEVIKAND
jgi:glycosyltransferase involved in cell wall biosynthesis